jgi:AMP-activated protein kinase-like protein
VIDRRAIARRILVLLCFPPVAWGQRVSTSLDIGGAAMRYADSLTANGGALSPAIALEWPRATVGGAATFSHFPSGWSSQGAVNGSVFSHAAGSFVAELAGTAGGSAHQDGTRTGQALGAVRGHLMTDRSGAWAGSGMGRTWDGESWRNVVNGELGVWMKASDATFVASATPTLVDSLRYTDSQLSAHWSNSSVELGAEIGLRAGATGTILGGTGRRWGSMAVTTWFAPQVGLVLAGGTYPIDLTQGFPGGRFLTFSVRLRSAPEGAGPGSPDRRAATTGADDREPQITFQALPASSGQVRLEIVAPGARSVEVMGDFTAWKPIQLVGGSGKWSVSLPIAPGTHQLNIRLNGGRWTVPPGLPSISDEFGGSAGLLVIESQN